MFSKNLYVTLTEYLLFFRAFRAKSGMSTNVLLVLLGRKYEQKREREKQIYERERERMLPFSLNFFSESLSGASLICLNYVQLCFGLLAYGGHFFCFIRWAQHGRSRYIMGGAGTAG